MHKTMQFNLTLNLERIVAVIGVVFGLATLAAGGSVLFGRDPGYVVYRPLLVFNTVMGLVYIRVALAAWRQEPTARGGAGMIALANAAVLAWIVYLFRTTIEVVAVDSVRAMTLRTAVWLVLWMVLAAAKRPR